MARSVGLRYSRIQFTSDLLPADIIGVNVYDQHESKFAFKPGPIFANVVLADEINRTTPRTQSALLEAMSERQVSIDDVTRELEPPFLVIATQNPLESHGTYPLPESQLDRFLMRVSVGYPERDVERSILLDRRGSEPIDALEPVLCGGDLVEMQAAADEVRFDPSLADYVMNLVEATRATVRLQTGVSTRGALALMAAAKAHALVRGRDYWLPDDVKSMTLPVLAHRVSLGAAEQVVGSSRRAAEALLRELSEDIEVPV